MFKKPGPIPFLMRSVRTTASMGSRELERNDIPVPLGKKWLFLISWSAFYDLRSPDSVWQDDWGEQRRIDNPGWNSRRLLPLHGQRVCPNLRNWSENINYFLRHLLFHSHQSTVSSLWQISGADFRQLLLLIQKFSLPCLKALVWFAGKWAEQSVFYFSHAKVDLLFGSHWWVRLVIAFSLFHSFQQTLCQVFSLLCTWYSLWETSLLCWSPKNMSSSSDEYFICIEICLRAPPYFSTINYIFISEGLCLLSCCSFHLSSRASGWLFRTSRYRKKIFFVIFINPYIKQTIIV